MQAVWLADDKFSPDSHVTHAVSLLSNNLCQLLCLRRCSRSRRFLNDLLYLSPHTQPDALHILHIVTLRY